MTKKIVLLLCCMQLITTFYACDLCSIYKGIEVNDYKNSFGLRHRYRLFESDFTFQPTFTNASNLNNNGKGLPKTKHLDHSIVEKNNNDFTYAESYTSYDIFANFYLNHRLKLNVSTYFSDNYTYKNDSLLENVSGIGDITLLTTYQLYNTKKTDTNKVNFTHRLNVGGGVAIPTGNFNKKTITGFETEIKPNVILGTPIQTLDPHLQSGTGAFGFVFLAEYMVKFKNIGLNTNISYKKNLENKNNFRFADRINANVITLYMLKISENYTLVPTIGLSFENAKRDEYNNEPFIGSGGNVLFMNSGLNLIYKKWELSFSYYNVVTEKLNDLQPSNKNRIITQLSYYFN